MPDHITTPDARTLQTACQSIAQSVASSIVDALTEPLRQQIEAKINAMIAEATKDVHSKIAAALAQIQPIQIPINLLAQPIVQPFSSAAPPPSPAPVPAPPEAQVTQTPSPSTPEAAAAEPVAAPRPVDIQDPQDTSDTVLTRDPRRTPKKSEKTFTATIVGLMPGQAHMIKNDFKFAKLAFVTANARNSTQLVALSKSNNPVLFMTDFIRHASVESVRAVHGNWVYVSGGMSSLREKLRELYTQHQNNASPLGASA